MISLIEPEMSSNFLKVTLLKYHLHGGRHSSHCHSVFCMILLSRGGCLVNERTDISRPPMLGILAEALLPIVQARLPVSPSPLCTPSFKGRWSCLSWGPSSQTLGWL